MEAPPPAGPLAWRCVDVLAGHVERVRSLAGCPEWACLELFRVRPPPPPPPPPAASRSTPPLPYLRPGECGVPCSSGFACGADQLKLSQKAFLRGVLTPDIVDVFACTGHEAVLEAIQELGLSRWTAPVPPTFCRAPLL